MSSLLSLLLVASTASGPCADPSFSQDGALAKAASAAASSEKLVLQTKDGKILRATVLELSDDRARLEISAFGGSARVTRKLDDFIPRSIFDIEKAGNPPGDFDQHLALARRAAELDLVQSAGDEARAAVESLGDDPQKEAKQAAVRSWAADALEEKIRGAIQEGDEKRASDLLGLLSSRLSDQRSEEELEALAGQLQSLEQQRIDQRAAEREARLDERAREELRRRAEPIRAKAAVGDRAFQEALKTSSSTSRSARACEKAVSEYKAAWKQATALAEKYPDDEAVQEAVSEFCHELEQKGIRAALHAASVLTTQSDFVGAIEWCERILAFDEDNAEARSMLATVKEAQQNAAAWKWDWRRRGRRGPMPTPELYRGGR